VHEPKGAQVVDDLVAWLDGEIAKTPVPAPPIYRGHLGGDPRGWSQVVSIAGGISRLLDDDRLHAGADLAIALARPRPIGWSGALTARWINAG